MNKVGLPFAMLWGSVKTWVFLGPALLCLTYVPSPWPTIFIAILSIYSCRMFFRMVGLYQFSSFVLICYLFIGIMALFIEMSFSQAIPLLPSAFIACVMLIPLFKRSFSQMLQYISLSFLTFMLWGWSFMHMAMILKLERGLSWLIYFYILIEVNNLIFNFLSYYLRRKRCTRKKKESLSLSSLRKVAPQFTLWGGVGAFVGTLILSYYLYPIFFRELHWPNWVLSVLIISILSYLGVAMMNILRKDLRIKSTVMGPLVIPYHNLLSIVDKWVFVAPSLYFYLSFFGID